MMQQSNALRRLETILDEAVSTGHEDKPSGPIILKVMKLSKEPQNLVDFYEVLSKAKEEARKLKNISKIDRYIKSIEELQTFFIIQHLWNTQWKIFADHIKSKDVLNTLDALANFFHYEHHIIFLEQDFLEKLKVEFEDILNEVIDSKLPKELKRFLTIRLDDIISAIRRYHIDGTEGLGKSAQSLVSDLARTEVSFNDEDKKNPTYKRMKSWVIGLFLYIVPSPYDIIGAVPDIHDFWMPKFEDLSAGQERVEQIIEESSNIQEVLEKASSIFDKQEQKHISGSQEMKALPAAKEDLENTIDDESNS